MTVFQGIYAYVYNACLISLPGSFFYPNAALPFLILFLFYLFPSVQFHSLIPTPYELSLSCHFFLSPPLVHQRFVRSAIPVSSLASLPSSERQSKELSDCCHSMQPSHTPTHTSTYTHIKQDNA